MELVQATLNQSSPKIKTNTHTKQQQANQTEKRKRTKICFPDQSKVLLHLGHLNIINWLFDGYDAKWDCQLGNS